MRIRNNWGKLDPDFKQGGASVRSIWVPWVYSRSLDRVRRLLLTTCGRRDFAEVTKITNYIHRIARCRVHLTPSECYSPYLPRLAWGTISKSTVSRQPDLVWSSSYLQPEQIFLNHLPNILWSTEPLSFARKMFFVVSTVFKAQFERVKSDYIARSYVRLSNLNFTTILLISDGTFLGFSHFGHMT